MAKCTSQYPEKDAEVRPQCASFLDQPPVCFSTTLYTGRLGGFMEFDATRAVQDWRK